MTALHSEGRLNSIRTNASEKKTTKTTNNSLTAK